jgi:hypothetical protein
MGAEWNVAKMNFSPKLNVSRQMLNAKKSVNRIMNNLNIKNADQYSLRVLNNVANRG